MYDEFFQQGGGTLAPSFHFGAVGDVVQGEIIEIEQQDQTDINDPNKKIINPKTGLPKQQLRVVLQTSLRGWQGVSNIPTNRDPVSPQPLPPSEDTGARAIYVKGWMTGAVGDAVKTATGQLGAPRVGGMLAVRHSGTRPAPGKPQPIKLYEAHYQAPAVGAEMFQQAAQPEQAPQQQAWGQQAPAPQAPPAQQAPQQQAWGQPAPQAPAAQGVDFSQFQQPTPQQTADAGWAAQQQAPQAPPAQQQWQAPPAPQAPAAAPAGGDPWANAGFPQQPPF